jgi:hypothetical protein
MVASRLTPLVCPPAAPVEADSFPRTGDSRACRVVPEINLKVRNRLGHAFPSLCPVRALLFRVPFGSQPWLHQLRHRSPGFVRRLRCYYSGIRLLRTVHWRLRLLTFPPRTILAGGQWSIQRSPGSRTRSFCTCQGLRPRRVRRTLAITRPSILPSDKQTASAPGIRTVSRLHVWPMHSPTDASPTPSRAPARGSGPMWICWSFIVGDFHLLLLAGLPAHSLALVSPDLT